MKKILLTTVLFVTAMGLLQAQDLKQRKQGPVQKRHHAMALKKLNLTEDQKKQFRATNEDFKKKMLELKKNEDITVREWKAKREELAKQHKQNMQDLLTNDQKAQLKKHKEERMAMAKVDAKARREKMKIHLGLSDEQAAKLDRNREEVQKKIKAIHENDNLSIEEKRDQSKELMKANKEKIKSILTDEQLKKMKEMPKRKPGKRVTV